MTASRETPDTAARLAVVTGAGRGMGRAIAHALARTGATVIGVSRTGTDLEATVAGAPGPGRVVAMAADVGSERDTEALFGAIAIEHGPVELLVAAHGIYQGGVGSLDLGLDQFDRTMRVNLRACLHCAQLAGRAMRDAGRGGRIVFISSMNAVASQDGAIDYDTSKAALNGLTRALALALAPFAITVNAIAPGWVRTPMSATELEHLDAEGFVMNPLHRVGSPAEIADAVLWLTGPSAGYVTGAIIPVDGGQTAMLPLPWQPGG